MNSRINILWAELCQHGPQQPIVFALSALKECLNYTELSVASHAQVLSQLVNTPANCSQYVALHDLR